MEKRNWKIYFEWIDGKDYEILSGEFNLSPSTIKDIVTSKIPDKVKKTSWQTANQYKKYREWQKKILHDKRAGNLIG